MKMLNLSIDRSWEPQDFIEVIQSIESMYYKISSPIERRFRRHLSLAEEFYLIEGGLSGVMPFGNRLDLVNLRLLERARYKARPYERLFVRRIEYASPGGIDFMGIGKVVEVIANSIGRMKVYWDDAHIRRERDAQMSLETLRKRVELDEAQESLRSIQIRNAREALELLEKFPGRHDALVPLLVRDQEHLSSRIAEGKLISATTSDSDKAG
jgi:hypothetical protein